HGGPQLHPRSSLYRQLGPAKGLPEIQHVTTIRQLWVQSANSDKAQVLCRSACILGGQCTPPVYLFRLLNQILYAFVCFSVQKLLEASPASKNPGTTLLRSHRRRSIGM